MKKTFTTLLLCTLFAVGALAQDKPTAVIYEASEKPIIDGIIDDVWSEAPENPLERNVINEETSLGLPGETYWQGLWTEEGMWVLLTVADDVFFPYYAVGPSEQTWQYDKTELYFDTNYLLEDGGGPLPDWVGGGNGHYQIDIPFAEGLNDGTPQNNPRAGLEDVQVAFNVYDPDYIAEYFVPFSALTNGDGGPINLTEPVGFDVYIIDRDNADDPWGNLVWANTGGADGSSTSWNNMDECGTIEFDGAELPIFIESITLTGGDITENNGTLQVIAEIEPADANEGLKWSVADGEDGGRATIDKSTGLVTAVLDGTVIVTCSNATDGFIEETVEVNISEQLVTLKDVNVIRNPNFDRTNENDTPFDWGGAAHEGGAGAQLPTVVDGEVVCAPIESTEEWHYQFDQMGVTALPNMDYIFSFVARADDTRPITVNFEDADSEAEWNQYGATTHPSSATGRSSWNFDLTTENTRYEFDVNFDEITPTTIQRLCFQLGISGVTLYLDSFVLVSVADYELIEDYNAVTWIDVSGEGGATSVALGGTLQMSAEVSPEDADYLDVRWSVEPGTGWATIDKNGLLTGDSSGIVTVIASAMDDSGIKGTAEVFVSWPEGISDHSVDQLKVYPNPAVNELTVELTRENALVSIYNSLGQKMDEILVTGIEHRFNISRYASGIYYVKTGNSVAKFIK